MPQLEHLREGFTTGTAATAASLACLSVLLTGTAPKSVLTPLPPFTKRDGQLVARAYLDIPITDCRITKQGAIFQNYPSDEDSSSPNKPLAKAWASVIKDGGSDPDVTHKAAINVTLSLKKPDKNPTIEIIGGEGVGKVTLPGLPLPIGSWAINPVPRLQIAFALEELWQSQANLPRPSMLVEISVPQGVELAKQTFNPRLGILGGISILGTQGTVKPYSHAAFQATIVQELKVASSLGLKTVYLTTGRRSANFLQTHYPTASKYAFVQTADYLEFAFRQAHNLGFTHIILGCFFGKLLKLAQGHGLTHAHHASLDFQKLALLAKDLGYPTWTQLEHLTTAAQAWEILSTSESGQKVLAKIQLLAKNRASHLAAQEVSIHLFDFTGRLI